MEGRFPAFAASSPYTDLLGDSGYGVQWPRLAVAATACSSGAR